MSAYVPLLWQRCNYLSMFQSRYRFTYGILVKRTPVKKSFSCWYTQVHDDVIKWKHFPRYWPFVRWIHRSPANSSHKSQWRGALMFSFICAWINGWVNNDEAGDLRRHSAHYDVTVLSMALKLRHRFRPHQIDVLVQDCNIFIANAQGIMQPWNRNMHSLKLVILFVLNNTIQWKLFKVVLLT